MNKNLKSLLIILALLAIFALIAILFIKPTFFPTVSNNPKISGTVRNFQDSTANNAGFERIALDGCDIDIKGDKTILKAPVAIKDETRTINQFVTEGNDLKIFCINSGAGIAYTKEAIKSAFDLDAVVALRRRLLLTYHLWKHLKSTSLDLMVVR
jgi:hypothetical protein